MGDTEDTDVEFIGISEIKPSRLQYRHVKIDDDNYALFVSYAIRHGLSRNDALGRLLVIADNAGDFPAEKKRRYY